VGGDRDKAAGVGRAYLRHLRMRAAAAAATVPAVVIVWGKQVRPYPDGNHM
jgi:hypothetical protein